MSKMSGEEFIEKSIKIHHDKYDYSLVEYVNSSIKVKILCRKHGFFEITPNNHLMGSGCPKCVGKNITNEELISRFKIIHKNKNYDYSLIDYKNCKTKIKIICPIHGEFHQISSSHLKGIGCPKCSGKNKTKEEIIFEFIKIHGYEFDYSLVVYDKAISKIKIICPKHGIFEQTASNHLAGNKCPKCNGLYKSNEDVINEFIKVHGNKYDYSIVEYKDSISKVKIICKLHGIFEQRISHHLKGAGCPRCKVSSGEERIIKILNKNNIKYIREYKFLDCKNIKNLRFDFYLNDHNTVVEYNGRQHYVPVKYFGGELSYNKIKNNDNIKVNYCLKNNINLLIIKYDNNDIEKSILDNLNEKEYIFSGGEGIRTPMFQ